MALFNKSPEPSHLLSGAGYDSGNFFEIEVSGNNVRK
jgi:hypothetical protein